MHPGQIVLVLTARTQALPKVVFHLRRKHRAALRAFLLSAFGWRSGAVPIVGDVEQVPAVRRAPFVVGPMQDGAARQASEPVTAHGYLAAPPTLHIVPTHRRHSGGNANGSTLFDPSNLSMIKSESHAEVTVCKRCNISCVMLGVAAHSAVVPCTFT